MGVADCLTTALSDRYAIESESDSGGMVAVCRARGLKHYRSPAVRVGLFLISIGGPIRHPFAHKDA
jgi:hypothetical protein